MFIKFRGGNATNISWETTSYKQGSWCITNRNNPLIISGKSLKIAFDFISFLLFDSPKMGPKFDDPCPDAQCMVYLPTFG